MERIQLKLELMKSPGDFLTTSSNMKNQWNSAVLHESLFDKIVSGLPPDEGTRKSCYAWVEIENVAGGREMMELWPFKECSVSRCGDPRTLYLSPVLWFNMKGAAKSLEENIANVTPVSNQDRPKHFQTVRFACIRSPGNLDNAERWYPLLKARFGRARLLKKGDIVCCSAATLLPAVHRARVIYFRLVQTEPEEMIHGLVETDKTFLFISGFIGSFIPVEMEEFLTTSQHLPLWHHVVKIGLERELSSLLEIFRKFSSKDLKNPPAPSVLLSGERASGKRMLAQAVGVNLNMQVVEINAVRDVCADTIAAAESRIQHKFDKASLCAPCIVLLSHMEFFGKSKHEPRLWQALVRAVKDVTASRREFPVYVIGTCVGPPSHELEDLFTVIQEIKCVPVSAVPPLMKAFCGPLPNSPHDLDYVGFVNTSHRWDMGVTISLVESAEFEAFSRCVKRKDSKPEKELKQTDLINGFNEGETVLGQHFKLKTPATTWNDIGGLENAKLELLRLIELPLRCQQIADSGLQRFGVLLCGPPGNGKTLLAKAVANQCSLNFINVKGPELINMYVGQSEENVRATFERARKSAPSLIFFDELDSIVPSRGRSGDSGGVIDRVVSQMMTEMDGLTKHAQVFVLGATNRPDLIDPALLRPGRFDRIVHIGNPTTSEHRLQILRAVTRKCILDSQGVLEEVERKLPMGISGAEIYAVCADAVLFALQRLIHLGLYDAEPVIIQGDFDQAIQQNGG